MARYTIHLDLPNGTKRNVHVRVKEPWEAYRLVQLLAVVYGVELPNSCMSLLSGSATEEGEITFEQAILDALTTEHGERLIANKF